MAPKDIHFRNIALLRQRDGMSQAELAQKLGKSQQSVARWEAGWGNLPTPSAIKIADIFDVTMETVIGLAPVPKRLATIEEKLLEFRALDLGLPEAADVDDLTREVFEKYRGKPEQLDREARALKALIGCGKTKAEMTAGEIIEIVLAA